MKKLLYILLCISLCFAFILLSIFSVSNNESFYMNQYKKNDTEKVTGMSLDDLEKTTILLLDYLNDKSDSLSLEVVKYSEKTQVFYDREIDHMVDVKNLYLTFFNMMLSLFAFSFIGFIYLYFTDKKLFFNNLFSAFKKSLVISGSLIIVTGGLIAFNFSWFWTSFHLVFFTNDLWLLDPKISTMINMFPLNFFYSICVNILILLIVLLLATFILLKYLSKKFR